ncbi:MAG: SGNH/GDSL hydrolase family protein [Elusimicrobiota bacterium]
MMRPRRAELLLVLGAIAAGLLLTEGLIRVFRLAEYSGGEGPSRPRRTYRYNREGFRGPDLDARELENHTVILGLGDSFAFGQGVGRLDTSLARLEGALNADGRERFRVLNRARPGMNTAQELLYLKEHGLRLRPKAVLLHVTLNDAESDMYRYRTLTPWPETEKRWLWRSHLYFYLVIAYNAVAHPYRDYVRGLYAANAPGFAEFSRSLREIAAVCREHGIAPLMAIFPLFDEAEEYQYAAIHRRLRELGAAAGYRVVDLLPVYQASGRPLHRYRVSYSDGHPNAAAHALAAAALLPAVEEALKD